MSLAFNPPGCVAKVTKETDMVSQMQNKCDLCVCGMGLTYQVQEAFCSDKVRRNVHEHDGNHATDRIARSNFHPDVDGFEHSPRWPSLPGGNHAVEMLL